MNLNEKDTIAAISTPLGESGIGIVRLSGGLALEIASKLFVAKNNKPLNRDSTFVTRYGRIHDNGKTVDEILLTVMLAPKTYTREDVVEFSCHGGLLALKTTLELCLRHGARLAGPGEFTLRAFLNGRIDLAQAEAVINIIRAKTDLALKCALRQLDGQLSKKLYEIKEKLTDALSGIEASLDYPEEDENFELTAIPARLKASLGELDKLIETSRAGSIIKDGLVAVIVGKPNVGKSSILNMLLKQEKAIVTPFPGTTRDIVEDVINIKGIPVRLMDTAGIRHTKDEIEVIGVEKSRKSLKTADLVLFVIDLSGNISEEDRSIASDLEGKQVLIVENKNDLPAKTTGKDIASLFSGRSVPEVSISAKENKGLAGLENGIYSRFISGDISVSDEIIVTDLRHREALLKTRESLERALEAIEKKSSGEFIALDLRQALEHLGEIAGKFTNEDLLDRIFSSFCIGK